MGRFTGKVAVVTGAGSGIGRATALRLASEGAAVACLDLAEDAAAKTAAQACEEGGQGRAFACDVSDPASVRTSVEALVLTLGPPDAVCNIAGIGMFAHTVDQTLDGWDRILAVNLTGTFLMCQATLPYLLERSGNIVNAASNAGIKGQPYSAAYCASKGGVIALTRALACEYLERGVRINAVAPGGIDTPMHAQFALPEGASPALLARIMSPMGFGRAEEVAGLIAFVASDEARYVTGSVLSMDGGITA